MNNIGPRTEPYEHYVDNDELIFTEDFLESRIKMKQNT